jgi:hypothetical protein
MSPVLALNGQTNRACGCPLLDQSGHRWVLAPDRLSAFDPKATFASALQMSPSVGEADMTYWGARGCF